MKTYYFISFALYLIASYTITIAATIIYNKIQRSETTAIMVGLWIHVIGLSIYFSRSLIRIIDYSYYREIRSIFKPYIMVASGLRSIGIVIIVVGVIWLYKSIMNNSKNTTSSNSIDANNRNQNAATVSKALFLAFIPSGMILGTIFTSVAMYSRRGQQDLMIIGFLFVLVFFIFFWVLVHKMWAVIQDGNARTTPGKAVGYMFIPFYNIYWIFVALAGFAKDYNAYIERHGIQAKPLSEGLFLAFTWVWLLGALPIPIVGEIFSFIEVILSIFIVNSICDAINAVPRKVESNLEETN